MKKIVLPILFFLCYSTRFIKKDIKLNKFDVVYYHHPRWYSPFYFLLILIWLLFDLLTLQPGAFFIDLKKDFNQKKYPLSHSDRIYGNLSKTQINLYILISIYTS
jgi:hypothetical protein